MVRRGHAFHDKGLGDGVVRVGEAVAAGVGAASLRDVVVEGKALSGFPCGKFVRGDVGNADMTFGGERGLQEIAKVGGCKVEQSRRKLCAFW